jgi:two-component system OmpR family response regulator
MNETILVVDDVEVVRESIASTLTMEGYRVIEAADGEEAVGTTVRDKPNLIILDADIPKKNGFDVCQELKNHQDPDVYHIPVLMITGVFKRPEHNARALLRCKADDYMLKPFSMEQLLHRVRIVLAKAGQPD